MDYNEMQRVLNNPKSSKERLREALSFALGVEYVPAKKEASSSVFNECKALWFRHYNQEAGLVYSFTGVDGKALKELIGKVESITTYPVNHEAVVNTFGVLLEKLPDWYRKNAFSLPVINKKFNDIVASIKQNNDKGQGNISAGYKQKLIDDLQS